MSFLEHLEELRWHVIRSLIAIISAGFICFLMKDFIFDTIIFGPNKLAWPKLTSYQGVIDEWTYTLSRKVLYNLITHRESIENKISLSLKICFS